MSEEIAAVCSECQETTRKIYGNYQCADCYIADLEDELKGIENYNKEIISTLEHSVEFYKQQVEDQVDLLSFKVAYEVLVAQLVKLNKI